MLPASRSVNRSAAPHAGSPVEIEEGVGARSPAVLKNKVAIEQDGFHLGQEAVVAVEVRPARLHHTDSGIGKVVHDLHEPFPGRHEIGIENGNELTLCHPQALIQSSCFEAMAIDAVNVDNSVSEGLIKLHGRLGNFYRAVGGVVQNLNFQLVCGIIQVAAGLDQPVNDELLVEDGELHRDAGKFGEV